VAGLEDRTLSRPDRSSEPSGFTCPDCQGTLFAIEDAGLLRFRCLVGHAWSTLALLTEHVEAVDNALWMAVRSLEERAALSRRLAERANERGNVLSLQRYLERATEATRSARVVRRLLEQPLATEPDATRP
jgi:two-component system chemotaxis response regulator CheB